MHLKQIRFQILEAGEECNAIPASRKYFSPQEIYLNVGVEPNVVMWVASDPQEVDEATNEGASMQDGKLWLHTGGYQSEIPPSASCMNCESSSGQLRSVAGTASLREGTAVPTVCQFESRVKLTVLKGPPIFWC